jgi:hypothetical protein
MISSTARDREQSRTGVGTAIVFAARAGALGIRAALESVVVNHTVISDRAGYRLVKLTIIVTHINLAALGLACSTTVLKGIVVFDAMVGVRTRDPLTNLTVVVAGIGYTATRLAFLFIATRIILKTKHLVCPRRTVHWIKICIMTDTGVQLTALPITVGSTVGDQVVLGAFVVVFKTINRCIKRSISAACIRCTTRALAFHITTTLKGRITLNLVGT